MSLNQLPAKDNYRREVRTEWGGINLNENAGDGELIEAMNMSSREYPLLATEKMCRKNILGYRLYAPFYYNGEGGVVAVTENNVTTYKIYEQSQVRNATVNITENKLFQIRTVIMQNKLWIFPSKQVYDFSTHTISNMESKFMDINGEFIFRDGELYDAPAEANTLYVEGANWSSKFNVGDAVTITSPLKANNKKTAIIIREIDGDELRFDEGIFSNRIIPGAYVQLKTALSAGDYYFTYPDGTYGLWTAVNTIPAGTVLSLVYDQRQTVQGVLDEPYTVTTWLVTNSTTASGTRIKFTYSSVQRTVPDMDFVCVNENRIWGCKGDTIYASKLGEPLNWNVMQGISTDSWATETGTPGSFTGCCSFQGYPTFFKEGCVFKVLGDEASNFALRKINVVGVAPYCDMSITEIRGRLYYVSIQGVMEWNGGDYPNIMSLPLGYDPSVISEYAGGSDGYYGASGGTDGNRYYLHCVYWKAGIDRALRLLIYDPRFGTWHEQEQTGWPIWFVGDGANFFMLKQYVDAVSHDKNTDVFEISAPWQAYSNIPEWVPTWTVTFADSTRAYKTALTGSESKKGVLRLLIRCKLAGSMKVWIAYDGGEFEQAAEFGGEDGLPKTSRVVPLILRRCDFWQLRLTGTGDAVIYSIAVEKYGGEWQQA